MRDRWDRLSDTNREDPVLSDLDLGSALSNAVERLRYRSDDRQSLLSAAAAVWIYLDAFLNEIEVSRDELFAAVCSQVDPQLLAEVNADTDSTDKAVEHIGGDAPSEAHDRVRAFVDVWKVGCPDRMYAAGTDNMSRNICWLRVEDLEQALADLESQQPTPDLIIIDDPVPTSRPPTPSDDSLKAWAEQARAMPGVHVATWWEPVSADLVAAIDKVEATVAVLTAIEGNVALAAEVLNVVEAYTTSGGAADSTRDHIADVVEFMSDLPKTMRGTDSTDAAMGLFDVDLSVVDWIKVAETVLGWKKD